MDVAPTTTIIESPFAADTEEGAKLHMEYLGRCLIDSLTRNEAPFASHGFYTMFLDDTVPEQRKQGMMAGWAWRDRAERVAFYVDHGISSGMMQSLEGLIAEHSRQHITFRSLDHEPDWMREVLDGLPDYIKQHLDGVRVY